MAAKTTQLTAANASAQQVKVAALAAYNQATVLLGKIATLQNSLTAATAFSEVCDGDDVSYNMNAILARFTILTSDMAKMCTDLTIPT